MSLPRSSWRAFASRYVIALGVAFVLMTGGLVAANRVIDDKLAGANRVDVHVAEGPAQGGNFLIIGSDTPVGSGIMPLAVVRTVLWLSALGPLAPEVAIALATGNTARAYGFDTGRIAPGLAADVLVMDAPRGSIATDALGAFRRGDNPGIALVMVDGQVITTRPRNTLPPTRAVHIKERPR